MKLLRSITAVAVLVASLPLVALAAPPVASSFSAVVAADRMSPVQLQGSDPDGTALTYAIAAGPSHGTLSSLNAATGAVVYVPAAGYVGADSFTYTVTSGGDTSAAGTVTLTVSNVRTRIIDTVVDPSGAPRKGKVTFVLTQPTTSPGGLTPIGATVSYQLTASGGFDVSLYPSRGMQPSAFYQLWFEDAAGGTRQNLGIYDVPFSTTVINLAPFKVTDTNLSARYTFASEAAVLALVQAIVTATTQYLLGGSPTANALQKYNATTGRLGDSRVSDNGTTITAAGNTAVTGSLSVSGTLTASGAQLTTPAISNPTISGPTISGTTNAGNINAGTVTATNLVGNCSGCTGITGATGGVSNTGATTIASTGGVISLQTAGQERLQISNGGLLSGSALDEYNNAGKVIECQGDEGGTFPNVSHGNFWPAPGTDLGTKFFWEAWARVHPGNEPGYIISDGYGGGHALLWGVTGNRQTGNVWNGTTQVTFGDSETIPNFEWVHLAVGWDGAAIVTYQNGVPAGRTAFAGPRQSTGAGAGTLFVCGSDHLNFAGRIAMIQGYDQVHPFYNSGTFPQKSIEAAIKRRPSLLGNVGSVAGDFFADYTKPATVIADHGTGVYGRTHPGVPTNQAPNTLTGAGGAMPIPRFVTDYTAPQGWRAGAGTVPAGSQNANPGAPAGALAFDSFSRANQTFVFGQTPTLGSTEAGSLGPLAWTTAGVPTNLYPAFNKWGILNGRAVFLEGDAPAGVAQVGVGTANQDVRVTRRVLTFDNGATGVAARVVDGNNFWFAASVGDAPTAQNVTLGYYSAGTRTDVAAVAAPATGWSTLRLVMYGTRAQVYADSTLLTTYNAATQHVAGTGAGLYAPRMSGLARYDNWAALAAEAIYLAQDDFNRADDALTLGTSLSGHSWTAQAGTWGVSSNRAYAPAGTPAIATLATGQADVTMEVTASTLSANNTGVVFRLTDSLNYWRVILGGSQIALAKIGAGTVFSIGSAAVTPASGDVVKVVAAGNSIQVYLNGVLQISATDSFNATAGTHGLWAFSSAARFDDFKVY